MKIEEQNGRYILLEHEDVIGDYPTLETAVHDMNYLEQISEDQELQQAQGDEEFKEFLKGTGIPEVMEEMIHRIFDDLNVASMDIGKLVSQAEDGTYLSCLGEHERRKLLLFEIIGWAEMNLEIMSIDEDMAANADIVLD